LCDYNNIIIIYLFILLINYIEEDKEKDSNNITTNNIFSIKSKEKEKLDLEKQRAKTQIRLVGTKSRPGNTYDGRRKVNQDSFISVQKILNLEDVHFFGVYDGHGKQ